MIFKRKIYNELLDWKNEDNGTTAILIKGARRVGKSTIAEEFARNEYCSYILIDFTKCSAEIRSLFDDVSDLNRIFLKLQLEYGVTLETRKSVIILMRCSSAQWHGRQSNILWQTEDMTILRPALLYLSEKMFRTS